MALCNHFQDELFICHQRKISIRHWCNGILYQKPDTPHRINRISRINRIRHRMRSKVRQACHKFHWWWWSWLHFAPDPALERIDSSPDLCSGMIRHGFRSRYLYPLSEQARAGFLLSRVAEKIWVKSFWTTLTRLWCTHEADPGLELGYLEYDFTI